jgi:hypothetical protein
LNSGDWIENLTALEYNEGEWKIYKYQEDDFAKAVNLDDPQYVTLNNSQLFENLVLEFNKLKG